MNKKITVIELLNKIANGEEMPKEIKFDNEVFVYIDKWEQYVTKEEEIPLLNLQFSDKRKRPSKKRRSYHGVIDTSYKTITR